MTTTPVVKILSTGGAGAAIGALRAAKRLGLQTGGAVPYDWADEEALREYGLVRMAPPNEHVPRAEKFALRSKANVDESDATLAFRPQPCVDVDKTIGYAWRGRWFYPRCLRRAKNNVGIHDPPIVHDSRPVMILDRTAWFDYDVERIRAWLVENRVCVLNVCGPSTEQYECLAFQVLCDVLGE